MLLTYEEFDAVEYAAVRALAGEAPIGGKLPISLPGMSFVVAMIISTSLC